MTNKSGIKNGLETRFKKGQKHTENWKNAMAKMKGRKITWGNKISKKLKGKRAFWREGEKNPNWKGGITQINKKIRHSFEYKLWRTAVFERDNYTCIWCGAKNGNGKTIILHADHIKPFADYPELRFSIDNGRTLCIDCHKTTFKKR